MSYCHWNYAFAQCILEYWEMRLVLFDAIFDTLTQIANVFFGPSQSLEFYPVDNQLVKQEKCHQQCQGHKSHSTADDHQMTGLPLHLGAPEPVQRNGANHTENSVEQVVGPRLLQTPLYNCPRLQ